ncbi:hypothetical protein F5J12DRAFT_697291, partial [Pisolithus orientalis]|uniref:uncharacterized protein n=1 Tax=Pisolithus orientalis TaxID=936130 RepID=UPI0022254387
YSSASSVHAKVIFQEKKQVRVVIPFVCLVFLPFQNPSLPMTVPVRNISTLEVRGKRFVLTYPPKEMHTPLYSSPSPTKNATGSSVNTGAGMTPRAGKKMLRISMIRSVEVLTPR